MDAKAGRLVVCVRLIFCVTGLPGHARDLKAGMLAAYVCYAYIHTCAYVFMPMHSCICACV
jgi:hypothetical protein